MKIVADSEIPFLQGVLEPVADVVYLPAGETDATAVRDADALMTRTRTRCNRALLEGSSVKFIASATIGFDHIDADACQQLGIEWTNAPGCNSSAVQQYIASSLLSLGCPLAGKTIGIVGVGNVGAKIAAFAEIFDMRVLLNDPPRARAEGSGDFVGLEQVKQEADIITLHVPLDREGQDRTLHLVDDAFLADLSAGTTLINSSRGPVVDHQALKRALKTNRLAAAILDVWEDEPGLDRELLALAKYATPHIAGYSADGKANGTSMSVQAVSRFFGLGLDDWYQRNVPSPEPSEIDIEGTGKTCEEILGEVVRATYDIRADDRRLRQSPETFETQRGEYPTRREFPAFRVRLTNGTSSCTNSIARLGFQIV